MKINLKPKYVIALFFLCLLNEVSFSQTIKTFSYDVQQISSYWISPLRLFRNIYPDTTSFPKLPDQKVILSLNEEFIVKLTRSYLKNVY